MSRERIDLARIEAVEALAVFKSAARRADTAMDRDETHLDVYAALGTSGEESPSYRGEELDRERERRDAQHERWTRIRGANGERCRESTDGD